MTWNVANKAFALAKDKVDEIEAISAITLLNAMLENVSELQNVIPTIIEKYLSELNDVSTSDYSIMLLQGILMCLWYDYGVTLQKLEEAQATEGFFSAIFEKVPNLK